MKLINDYLHLQRSSLKAKQERREEGVSYVPGEHGF